MKKPKKNVIQSHIWSKKYYDNNKTIAPLFYEKIHYYILQCKADRQESNLPFRDFRGIGLYVVQKMLASQNYISGRLVTNATRILHRIRPRNYTTRASLEDSFTSQNFQFVDNFVFLKDVLYSVTWEAKSNSWVLKHPKLYCDPVMLKNSSSRNCGTQQNADDTFSYNHNKSSHSNNDKLHSAIRSSQDYVNPWEHDRRISAEASTEKSKISKSCYDSISRHNEESTASTDTKISIDQKD